MIELHNQEREKHGLTRLTVNSLLINSATSKGQAMLASDCWSHYCPNGKSPWTFFQEAGYSYTYAGENLAEGFSDDETVMNAWMNSPTHRANVLKSEFREIGIGVVQGSYQGNANNTIIVVHFGTQVDSNFNLPTQNNKPVPTTVKDLTPPENPVITSPVDGQYLNDELFTVSGEIKENATIEVFDNGEVKGSILSNGGVFDYKPPGDKPYTQGAHKLTVQATDSSGNKSGISNEVNVEVDLIPPAIDTNVIEILSTVNEGQLRMRVYIDDNTQSVTVASGENKIEFVDIPNSNYWEADIDKNFFVGTDNVTISAVDKAGNSASEGISSSSVLGSIDKVNLQLSSGIGNANIMDVILSRELPSIKNVVSLIFTLFILALFIIDAFMLAKTNIKPGFGQRSKSHFHISAFVIIVLVVLIGGFSGHILNGIGQ